MFTSLKKTLRLKFKRQLSYDSTQSIRSVELGKVSSRNFHLTNENSQVKKLTNDKKLRNVKGHQVHVCAMEIKKNKSIQDIWIGGFWQKGWGHSLWTLRGLQEANAWLDIVPHKKMGQINQS